MQKAISFWSDTIEHMPSLYVDAWVFELTEALSEISSDNMMSTAAFSPLPGPSHHPEEFSEQEQRLPSVLLCFLHPPVSYCTMAWQRAQDLHPKMTELIQYSLPLPSVHASFPVNQSTCFFQNILFWVRSNIGKK